ncbi:MAG: outer membrane beta-barrel protein [Tannerella sp.]|jgi:hypothetical protein|nr:outer membrane beta-barrel protein [Tannerella sp.]
MNLKHFNNNWKIKKQSLLILVISMMTVASGYAQFFVEGSMSVNQIGYERKYAVEEETDLGKTVSFGLSPKVGYWFNDRVAAGISASYEISDETSKVLDQEDQAKKRNMPSIGISVFSRYKFFQIKKIAVLAEGSVGSNWRRDKMKEGSDIRIDQSSTSLYINVRPLLTYDLTDKYSLETICDFAGLIFNATSTKDELTGNKYKTNNFRFNTGSTLISSLGNISIGLIYKF